jgi:chromosome segregation ATPase
MEQVTRYDNAMKEMAESVLAADRRAATAEAKLAEAIATLATERTRANELTQELLDAHNSYATERAARIDAGRQAIENWTDALALGKERDDARRERDAERAAREELEKEVERLMDDQGRAEVARLTSALAGARERIISLRRAPKGVLNRGFNHAIDIILAEVLPTTEPDKAEELNCPACGNVWDGQVCKTCGWNGVSYAPTAEPAKAEK